LERLATAVKSRFPRSKAVKLAALALVALAPFALFLWPAGLRVEVGFKPGASAASIRLAQVWGQLIADVIVIGLGLAYLLAIGLVARRILRGPKRKD
jgi:uncharacterized membrane protein